MFTKIINMMVQISRIISIVVMFLMMLFIFVAVISRIFFKPILGSVEIVEFGMIVIVMFGLAYTHYNKKHISIDMFVNTLPIKFKKVIELFADLLTFITTIAIGFVFVKVSIKYMIGLPMKSNLLSIPYYPFQFIILFGFAMWGIVAILEFVKSFVSFVQSKEVRGE